MYMRPKMITNIGHIGEICIQLKKPNNWVA